MPATLSEHVQLEPPSFQRTVPLHFVNSTGPRTTERSRELETSKLRAHAARVTYIRRSENTDDRCHSYTNGIYFEDSLFSIHDTEGPANPGKRLSGRPRSPILEEKEISFHEASPTGYLSCGSSDPFNAVGFKVTPQVNRVICHARDFCIPFAQIPKRHIGLQGAVLNEKLFQKSQVLAAERCREYFNLHFSCKGLMLASILTFTRLLIMQLPRGGLHELHKELLILRLESLRHLRSQLSSLTEESPPSFNLAWEIVLLFETACVEMNRDVAKIHARRLDWALQAFDPVTTVQAAMIATMRDIDSAYHTMQRPILDYAEWVPSKFEPCWYIARKLLPPVAADVEDVHPTVTSPTVRRSLIRLRICLAVQQYYKTQATVTDADRGEVLFAWAASIALCEMGVLLHHSLNLLDRDDGDVHLSSPGTRYLEAAMALCTLWHAREYLHQASVSRLNVQDDSYAIVLMLEKALRKALRKAQELGSAADGLESYSEAMFWMVFTGARAERRIQHGTRIELSDWFQRQLGKRAQLLNVTTWMDAKALLQHFVVTDRISMHPEDQYEDTIASYAAYSSMLPANSDSNNVCRSFVSEVQKSRVNLPGRSQEGAQPGAMETEMFSPSRRLPLRCVENSSSFPIWAGPIWVRIAKPAR